MNKMPDHFTTLPVLHDSQTHDKECQGKPLRVYIGSLIPVFPRPQGQQWISAVSCDFVLPGNVLSFSSRASVSSFRTIQLCPSNHNYDRIRSFSYVVRFFPQSLEFVDILVARSLKFSIPNCPVPD